MSTSASPREVPQARQRLREVPAVVQTEVVRVQRRVLSESARCHSAAGLAAVRHEIPHSLDRFSKLDISVKKRIRTPDDDEHILSKKLSTRWFRCLSLAPTILLLWNHRQIGEISRDGRAYILHGATDRQPPLKGCCVTLPCNTGQDSSSNRFERLLRKL